MKKNKSIIISKSIFAKNNRINKSNLNKIKGGLMPTEELFGAYHTIVD